MQFIRLLHLLSDGQFHSGQSLGLALGVSRTAVWKQINKIISLGIHIDSVHGKGYRLYQALSLLDANKISEELSETTKQQLRSVEVCLSVDSTNSYLMKEQSKDRVVCLAEQQTSGRGRHGKQWVSPFGQNIYLSLCWYFHGGAAQVEGLSLAVAVAVCRALEEIGLINVKVKWPNDLLYKNRKLAGILLEMAGDASGICKVVIGVGLNVYMDESRTDVDQPWIGVSEIIGKPISRDVMAGKIINHLVLVLLQFQEKGFFVFREEWINRDLYFYKPVKLMTSSVIIEGVEQGVDDRGALCVETCDGVKKFYGGEVSLRPI